MARAFLRGGRSEGDTADVVKAHFAASSAVLAREGVSHAAAGHRPEAGAQPPGSPMKTTPPGGRKSGRGSRQPEVDLQVLAEDAFGKVAAAVKGELQVAANEYQLLGRMNGAAVG